MKISIYPQLKNQVSGSRSELGIRLTVLASSYDKKEKEQLRDLLKQIEDSDSDIQVIADVIKKLNTKKTEVPKQE